MLGTTITVHLCFLLSPALQYLLMNQKFCVVNDLSNYIVEIQQNTNVNTQKLYRNMFIGAGVPLSVWVVISFLFYYWLQDILFLD